MFNGKMFATSLKAPLWRAKPCSAIGSEDNQLEAPFSDEASTTLCILLGIPALMLLSKIKMFSHELMSSGIRIISMGLLQYQSNKRC